MIDVWGFFCFCVNGWLWSVCLLVKRNSEIEMKRQIDVHLLDYCHGPVSHLTISEDWMQLLHYKIKDNFVFMLIKARAMGRDDGHRK